MCATPHVSQPSPHTRRDFRRTAALILILSFAGFAGCSPSARRPVDLPLYFTCDTRGRLEPCGCFTGQFGGLTRLKTVLDAEAPAGALRLDVGDAIGGREDYDLIEYGYILRAFAAMKYDALNIGHREARLTSTQLQQIKRASRVPILSANLLDKATGKRIFEPYRIVERGGFRIAVIGVVDPAGLNEDVGAGLEVAGMESTLSQLLKEVTAKSDLVVLLAFTDEASLARLAQQFFEIQIVLGGKVSQPAQQLKRENRSLVYFVTNESRALGLLRLRLQDGSPLAATRNEIRLLHDQIPQDASFRALAREYRDEIRRTALAVDNPTNAAADMVPGVRTVASYVGSQRCVECHDAAGALWARSAHAKAFAVLVQRQADADPKCVGCHTIGFGSVSGYRREFGAEKMVNVGCESCHGPGSLHVRQREGDSSVSFNYRPLGAGDCQKCHYGEFSRPFHWDEFWSPIRHGKESKLAAGPAQPAPASGPTAKQGVKK
jgi:hypothetical protein